jgi:hypothetical protein
LCEGFSHETGRWLFNYSQKKFNKKILLKQEGLKNIIYFSPPVTKALFPLKNSEIFT